MNKAIIIGGGVGPAAGLRLHRLILENTRTSGRDQDHLKIIHMCLPDMIEDRTEALLHGQYEKTAEGMARIIKAAAESCKNMGLSGIVGIPCNTFHASVIWNKFVSQIESELQNVQLVNMVDAALRYIQSLVPSHSTIGVLATSGTQAWQVYSKPLLKYGYNIIEPENQEAFHEMIYHSSWGLKACNPISQRAKQSILSEIDRLKEGGAQLIILGCTELPLIYGDEVLQKDLLDPLEVLARVLIKACCSDKLL